MSIALYAIGGPFDRDTFIVETDSTLMLRVKILRINELGCCGVSLHGEMLGATYSGEMTMRDALNLFR